MQEEEKKGDCDNNKDAFDKSQGEREKNDQLWKAAYEFKIMPTLKPLSLAQIENDSNESSSIFGGSESQSPWAGRQ